jgi:hypothetical protein
MAEPGARHGRRVTHGHQAYPLPYAGT